MVKDGVTFYAKEPVENPAPDWEMVLTYARSQFEAAKRLEREPKDIREYIYEGVMEAIYGTKFWPWFNERVNHCD